MTKHGLQLKALILIIIVALGTLVYVNSDGDIFDVPWIRPDENARTLTVQWKGYNDVKVDIYVSQAGVEQTFHATQPWMKVVDIHNGVPLVLTAIDVPPGLARELTCKITRLSTSGHQLTMSRDQRPQLATRMVHCGTST